jgi:hypothetical protein
MAASSMNAVHGCCLFRFCSSSGPCFFICFPFSSYDRRNGHFGFNSFLLGLCFVNEKLGLGVEFQIFDNRACGGCHFLSKSIFCPCQKISFDILSRQDDNHNPS